MEAIDINQLLKQNEEYKARIESLQIALDKSKQEVEELSVLKDQIDDLKVVREQLVAEMEKEKRWLGSRLFLLLKNNFITKADKIISACRFEKEIGEKEREGEFKAGKPGDTGSEEDNEKAFTPTDNARKKPRLVRRSERKAKEARENLHGVTGTPLSATYPVTETITVEERDKWEELLKKAGAEGKLRKIGESVIEELVSKKSVTLSVRRYVLPKYVVIGHPELGVLQAPQPPRILPKTRCSAELASDFIIDKFVTRLPYNSQENMWANADICLPRGLLSAWQMGLTEQIEPLAELISHELDRNGVIQMDETTVSIDHCSTSVPYIWIKLTANAEHSGCYYHLGPGRSKDVLESLVKGFTGYLQSDYYVCYNSLDKDLVGILIVPCAAHMRRYCINATNDYGGHLKSANDLINRFDRLFTIDRECYDEYETKHLDKSLFLKKRKELSLPVIDEIKTLLKAEPVLDNGKPVADSPRYQEAVSYIGKSIDRLPRYLERFELTPSNNSAERSNVGVKKGLDAWLKFGSERGAESACVIYTLARSAELNQMDPADYLRYVICNAPPILFKEGYDPANLSLWQSLLPWNVKEALEKK